MIAHNYFNVVFTPNFDDLLNEACCTYADCRPIVCAHDSAVADVRVTSARPKIVKLHGDFLYDSIKNTVKETETLEKNMRDKFMQFAREYGLIVVGYGGNDRSVMDILDMMLMSGGYFPNGLYWCARTGAKAGRKVERLLRREGAYWVEIDGFDEFMAELHESLGLTLPNLVRDPYRATTEKLNRFVAPREETKHPVIKDDIRELEEQIKGFERIVSGKAPEEEIDKLIPAQLLAELILSRNDYKNALSYYERALAQNPDDVQLLIETASAYRRAGDFEKALQISEKAVVKAPSNSDGYYEKGLALEHLKRYEDAIATFNQAFQHEEDLTKRNQYVVMSRSNVFLLQGNWEAALSDTEAVLRIDPKKYYALSNRCIALKKMGREEEATKILRDALPEVDDIYLRACYLATLSDRQDMLKTLTKAIQDDSYNRIRARIDPDFAEYQEDPDFRKLVYIEG
jgi:tetratricopeptide (TPR) repeat protein